MPTKTEDTREELVAALQRLADELGRSPTMADLRQATGYPPARRFLDEFGTWNQAKQAAGLETFQQEGRGTNYTPGELLDRLRELARTTGGPVTQEDANNSPNCPSAPTYQRHFSSWNEAKKAAGLETVDADETPVRYTDEELCDLLRRLAAAVDGPVTIRDLEAAEGYPDHTTFERRFGSWNEAKQAAGLDPVEKGQGQRGNTYSDEELLQLLRDCATEIGGSLTKEAVNQVKGYPSASTYRRRFGSWTRAKEKAGLV